jgi:hypothetical protein
VPAGVVTSLTRLAASINTTTGRVEVYVVIRKLPRARPGAPALRAGSDVVNAVAVDSHADALAGTALLTARQLDAPTSAISTARPGARPSAGVVVGILPDGVTRVTWRFTGAGIGILDPHPSTVSVPVHDNVAVVQSLRTWGPLARATWYGAAGQVIASADGGVLTRQQLETIRSINTTRHRPIDRALRADYSLFRSVPPDNLAHDPRIPIVGTGMGLNYWQIRYIPSVTGLDGPGLWITPGTNAICISDPQASTCGKLAGREPSGFIGGTTSNGHQTTISGLVPDGNPTVTIVLADHTHKTVPVIHNVYEATATGRIVTIISRNASGQIQHHSLR